MGATASVATPRLDEAYRYWGKTKRTEPYERIQNPGAKSVDSLVSKIKRNVEQMNVKDFTLAKVTDAARCSILFESYGEIPEFLQKVKQAIPSVQGWISRNNTGYKGIHMCFDIEGVSVEVQVSTYKAWPYKVIAEEFYAKWRDFNQKEEFNKVAQAKAKLDDLKKKIEADPKSVSEADLKLAEQEYDKLKVEFKSKLAEQDRELKDSHKLFEELHADGDFAKSEVEIEATLLSFELDSELSKSKLKKESATAKRNKSILSKTIKVDENGKVDEQSAKENSVAVNKIASETQDYLIATVEQTLDNLQRASKDSSVKKFDSKALRVSQYKEIAAELYKMNNRYIKSKIAKGEIDEEFALNNVRAFSYRIYDTIKKCVNFASQNNMLNARGKDILKEYYASLEREKAQGKKKAKGSSTTLTKSNNALIKDLEQSAKAEAEQLGAL